MLMEIFIGCLLIAFISTTNAQDTVSTYDVEDDAPPGWMDAIFLLWVLAIHCYYAYKFTDYSLDHIHRQLVAIDKAEEHMETQHAVSQTIHGADSMRRESSNPNMGNDSSYRHSKATMHVGHSSLMATTKSVSIGSPKSSDFRQNSTDNADFKRNSSDIIEQRPSNVEMISSIADKVQTPTTDDVAMDGLGLSSLNEFGASTEQVQSSSATNLSTDNINTEAGLRSLPSTSPSHLRSDTAGDTDLEREDSESAIQRIRSKVDEEQKIEIKVDYLTLARPLTGLPNTKCCCIFPWSHIFFSWSRTHAIRFFLRFAILLSCSLAFVLWIEFFGNAFLEYLITCFLERNTGGWLGFFLIPYLVFVLQTCLLYSWHALLIGWNMGSDKNGDMEALDSKRLRKAIKKLKSETKRLLRQKARNVARLRRESMGALRRQSMERNSTNAGTEEFDSDQGEKQNKQNENIDVLADEAGIPSDAPDMNKMSSTDDAKAMVGGDVDEETKFEDLFKFDASEIEFKLKRAIRKHQSVIVGDFFIGTCWRLQVVTATITMAVGSAFVRDPALFYQYLMRYLAMAGLEWCVVYFFFAIGISYYSRIASWKDAHPEIPIFLFFLFSDATDYDAGLQKDTWVLLKMCVAVFCVGAGTAMFVLGGIYVGSGYFYFAGATLVLYYLGTVLLTCKPFAVMALWRDEIPNPSVLFTEEIKRITHALQLWESGKTPEELALVYHQGTEHSETLEEQNTSANPDTSTYQRDAQTHTTIVITEDVSNSPKGSMKKPDTSGLTNRKSGSNQNQGNLGVVPQMVDNATGETVIVNRSDGGSTDEDSEIESDPSDDDDENEEKEKEKEKEKGKENDPGKEKEKENEKEDAAKKKEQLASLDVVAKQGKESNQASKEPKESKKSKPKLVNKSSKSEKPRLGPKSSNKKNRLGDPRRSLLVKNQKKSFRGLQKFWEEQGNDDDKTKRKKDDESDEEKDIGAIGSASHQRVASQSKSTKLTEKEEKFFDHVFMSVLGDNFEISSSDESDGAYDLKDYEADVKKLATARRRRRAEEQLKEEKKKKGKRPTSPKQRKTSSGDKKRFRRKRKGTGSESDKNKLGVLQMEVTISNSSVQKGNKEKDKDNDKDQTKENENANEKDDEKKTEEETDGKENEKKIDGHKHDLEDVLDDADHLQDVLEEDENEYDDDEDEDNNGDDDGRESDSDGRAEIDSKASMFDEDNVLGTVLDNFAQEDDHNMVDGRTGRVYSEFGRYTYRLIDGFEFTLKLKTDGKYKEYLDQKGLSKRAYYKGRWMLYNDKFANVFTNYKNYWLDVYRPYDEYDVDRTFNKTGFMYGFQCCKQWMNYRPAMMRKALQQRKRKKKKSSCAVRTGKFANRCLGWSFDHVCNILLAILAFAFLLSLYYFSTTIDISEGGNSSEFDTNRTNSRAVNCSNWTDVNCTFPEPTSMPTPSPTGNESDLVQHYTMCDTVWQDAKHRRALSVLDVLALTQIVYEQDDYDLLDTVSLYFGDDWEVVARRDIEPVFFHLRPIDANVDFIAVRGTSTPEEALQDVSLFIEVTGLQVLMWVFPFLNALPTGFLRTVVSYASFAEGLINQEARTDFADSVFDYAVEYLTNETDPRSLFVVGHSLGGAIAQIVGARLYEDASIEAFGHNVASFGLNSPGTVYSSAKFGFSISSLQLTSTTLKSERDIVSQVDLHSGNIQEVACNSQTLVSCHLTQTPFCEMYEHCPDDISLQPEVIKRYCTEDEYGYKIGASIGAKNSTISTITEESPYQSCLDGAC